MSIYPSPGILGIACTCILAVGGGGCKGPVCEKTISGQTIHFISSFQTLNNILPPQQGEQTSARVKVNCTSGGEDAAFFSGFWTLKLTLGTRSVLKLSAVGKKNKKSMISQPVNMPNGRTILESLSGFSKSQICFKIKKNNYNKAKSPPVLENNSLWKVFASRSIKNGELQRAHRACRKAFSPAAGAGTDQPTHKLGSTLTIWANCIHKNLISGQHSLKQPYSETKPSKGRNQQSAQGVKPRNNKNLTGFTNRVSFISWHVPFKREEDNAATWTCCFLFFESCTTICQTGVTNVNHSIHTPTSGPANPIPGLSHSTSAILCSPQNHCTDVRNSARGKGYKRGTWSSVQQKTTYDHLSLQALGVLFKHLWPRIPRIRHTFPSIF